MCKTVPKCALRCSQGHKSCEIPVKNNENERFEGSTCFFLKKISSATLTKSAVWHMGKVIDIFLTEC